MSNRLDPDQARHFVEPDLGPICLQKLKSRQIQLYKQDHCLFHGEEKAKTTSEQEVTDS